MGIKQSGKNKARLMSEARQRRRSKALKSNEPPAVRQRLTRQTAVARA